MASNTQHLEWHGQQWRVRIKVPAKLVPILNRTVLKYPLHTADLKEANERKWAVVARLKDIIAAARRALASNDPLEAEALRLRLYKDSEHDMDHAVDRAHAIEAEHGYDRAKSFYDLASGQATPLGDHADAFKAHKGYPLKTAGDFDRVLRWLRTWLRDNAMSPTIEIIDRRTAARFLSEKLAVGRSRGKAQAYLGFLGSYWKWMVEKGHLERESPWAGQSLPSAPRTRGETDADGGKRPYTDNELARLLYGPADRLLADLMRIAALSGMRLEEICQLRVADCAGGVFNVRDGKTPNAKRRIPIHTDLAAIVERRTEGKDAKAFLIEDLPDVPKSRETRSDPASKRFTRYRRRLGIEERPNDKAKSNVDFHSLRRWFIRQARDALDRGNGNSGFSAWTIADVVGHDDNGIKRTLHLTMGHYPGPASDDAMRACVLSAKLPAPPATN